MKLETQITQETLERNFAKLNSYIKTTAEILANQEVKLSDEQKARIAAMNEAVERANRFVEKRIGEINEHVNELLVDQQEIANMLDEEKVSHVEFTDEVNKLVQVDEENKSLILQTAETVTTTVGQLNSEGASPFASIAAIQVKADRIQQTVSNQAGEISGLTQRAGSIEATVATKADAASLQVTNNSISAVVTNLGKDPANSPYSSISALKGMVDLAVKDTDLTGAMVVSRLNLSPAGVKIAGKLIEIDGNTVFKGNVDVTGKITAANLGSLTNGVIGTLRTATSGARVEIKDNLITVYDSNNTLRVRLGVW